MEQILGTLNLRLSFLHLAARIYRLLGTDEVCFLVGVWAEKTRARLSLLGGKTGELQILGRLLLWNSWASQWKFDMGPTKICQLSLASSRLRAAKWPECFLLPEKERIQEDHVQRSFLQTSSKEFTACLLHIPSLAFLLSHINCSIVISVKQLETKWTQLVGEWLHKLWHIHTKGDCAANS